MEKLKVLVGQILNIGQKESNSTYLNGKIRICNIIAVLLILLGITYGSLSLFYYPIISIFPFIGGTSAFIAICLNRGSFYYASRFLISIAPVAMDSLYQASIVSQGEPVISSLYFSKFSFALYPWVICDLREKKLLFPTVFLCTLILIFQPQINNLIELSPDIDLFENNTWQGLFTSLASAAIMLTCLLSLIKKNEEIERDLVKSKAETEKNLVNLKAAQEQLIQSEKMTSLGVLTAGIAHEINNPLNFITGAHFGLKNHLKDLGMDQDEKTATLLTSIKTGVSRAASIITSLNQLNRDSSSFNESCDLHSILDNSLLILQNNLKDKIIIEKKYAPEQLLIKGNVGKLHRVFINLLSNACDAIEGQGKIEIVTKLNKGIITIIITDSGHGISKEVLPRITDPFFTTKDPGKGTGLGLSITHNIVQDHGGQLAFQSEPGKGTSVIIKLIQDRNYSAPV